MLSTDVVCTVKQRHWVYGLHRQTQSSQSAVLVMIVMKNEINLSLNRMPLHVFKLLRGISSGLEWPITENMTFAKASSCSINFLLLYMHMKTLCIMYLFNIKSRKNLWGGLQWGMSNEESSQPLLKYSNYSSLKSKLFTVQFQRNYSWNLHLL